MPRLVTSFDSVVLAAVARDVTALVGSRVVRVTQPAPEEVALAVRGPSGTATILSSIDPRWARIHLASPSASGEPSAFAQQLPSRPYVVPPADRPAPAILGAQALAALLSSSDEPLAASLVASVLGLSPPLAAEVAVRAGLDPAAPARAQAGGAARLWDALQDL